MFKRFRSLPSAVVAASLGLSLAACSGTSGAGLPSQPSGASITHSIESHGGTSTPAPVTAPVTNPPTTTTPPVNPTPGPGVANVLILRGGPGSGVVTSTPAGIDCHQTSAGQTGQCGFNFPIGTSVQLNARPDPGSGFQGFTDNCSGGSPQFTVIAGGIVCQVLFT